MVLAVTLSPRKMYHRTQYVKISHHPQNGSTYHIATPPENRNQHAQEFVEVWPCGFRDMRADKHTDTLITIPRTHVGAKSLVDRKHSGYFR